MYKSVFSYLRNQHRLILVVGQHVDVSAVRNGEDVGWHLRTTLATVQASASGRVHGESLVGVDSHTEETRVRLEEHNGELDEADDAGDVDKLDDDDGAVNSALIRDNLFGFDSL